MTSFLRLAWLEISPFFRPIVEFFILRKVHLSAENCQKIKSQYGKGGTKIKYQLIDIFREEEELELGTCEFCESICDVEVAKAKLQDENGKIFIVTAGEVDYGEYYDYRIDNVIDFAEFISSHEWDELEDPDCEFEQSRLFDFMYNQYINSNNNPSK